MTALEKSIKEIKKYVLSLDTKDNIVYKENELLILSCFSKSLEIIESFLEEEKQQIIDAYEFGDTYYVNAEDYYNDNYNQPK
jgi:hypothetical protein